jgi:hypothetical protein
VQGALWLRWPLPIITVVASLVVLHGKAPQLAEVATVAIGLAVAPSAYVAAWMRGRRFMAAFERARAGTLRGEREEAKQLLARLAARCLRAPHQHAMVVVQYAMHISWSGERARALAILEAVDASGWLELDMPSLFSSTRHPTEARRPWRVALLATRARCEIMSGDHQAGERSLARAEALVGAGTPPTILLFSRALLDGIRGHYEQVVRALGPMGEARDPITNALCAIRAFALERLGSTDAARALSEVRAPVFRAPASESDGLPAVWPEFVAFLLQHRLLAPAITEAQEE